MDVNFLTSCSRLDTSDAASSSSPAVSGSSRYCSSSNSSTSTLRKAALAVFFDISPLAKKGSAKRILGQDWGSRDADILVLFPDDLRDLGTRLDHLLGPAL